jgi:hypothetical protein
MRSFTFFLFFFAVNGAIGQLISGRLLDDERKLITKTNFIIEDSNEGLLLFELGVNVQGHVTSVKLLTNGTTVISTPTRIKVKNELMKWKFEEGTHYPEFHNVTVKITTQKLE